MKTNPHDPNEFGLLTRITKKKINRCYKVNLELFKKIFSQFGLKFEICFIKLELLVIVN